MTRELLERAIHWSPDAGDVLRGVVERLPDPDAYRGRSLIVRLGGGELALVPATAKQGATVIENALRRQEVTVGDLVRITYLGWLETGDGKRRYRMYEVKVR